MGLGTGTRSVQAVHATMTSDSPEQGKVWDGRTRDWSGSTRLMDLRQEGAATLTTAVSPVLKESSRKLKGRRSSSM